MELEFDKEINAILRKAGGNTGTATVVSPHLDADMIAAFAENALPDKAKRPLLEHFADCDRCRKMLSQSILLNSEADATAASSVVSAPVAEVAVPWYQKLFRTPNLAIAMGGLVLAFSGVLGYIVLQDQNASKNAQVAQLNEPETTHGGPYFGGEADGAAANTAAQPANSINLPQVASNVASNSSVSKSVAVSETAPGTVGRLDTGASKSEALDDRAVSSDAATGGTSAGLAKPANAPPPPPAPLLDGVMAEQDEKKQDFEKMRGRDKDMEPAKRKENEDRENRRRDLPPPASKSGPVRSGPLQNQSNQVNNRAYDMSVSRSVGGKSFNNRDGVWYDSAYHGQATTNVRRGTAEYDKLDRGVRNIANTLGGIVVVVWKEKAYRIQ